MTGDPAVTGSGQISVSVLLKTKSIISIVEVSFDCILQVVLFNIGSIYHKLGQMKADFWKYTHIGIPDPDTESNDAVVLGFLVAQFIGEV